MTIEKVIKNYIENNSSGLILLVFSTGFGKTYAAKNIENHPFRGSK